MSALVFIEMRDGEPLADSVGLLAVAGALTDGDVVAVVVGSGGENLSGLTAADKILEISAPEYGHYRPDLYVGLLAEAARQVSPDLILITNSYVGIDLTAALAARLGRPAVTYCTDLKRAGATLEAHSLGYGGKLEVVARVPLPAVAGVNAGALNAAPRTGRMDAVAFAGSAPASRIRFVEAIAPDGGGVDIQRADKLVCVGRGIGEQGDLPLAEDLAEALGAELAASRPIVDQGWLPKSRQVGKSGLKVTPKLYVALGVSGAPEHLEGMSEAQFIVAVNTDPSAPIFDVAHVGTTCDIADLAPALTARLHNAAGG